MFVKTFIIAFLLSSTLAQMPKPHVLTEDELSGVSRIGVEDTAVAIADMADRSAAADLAAALNPTEATPTPEPSIETTIDEEPQADAPAHSESEPQADAPVFSESDPQGDAPAFSELAYDEGKILCETKDGWAMIEETDKCIVDREMKEALVDCRVKIYGSSLPKEAYDAYCAANKSTQDTMDSSFVECLKEAHVTMEALHLEWITTCGFCMDPDLFNKTDECLESSGKTDLLRFWAECRQEIYSTANATEAAELYCARSIEERKHIDSTFDECLIGKDIDKDEFEKAIVNC